MIRFSLRLAATICAIAIPAHAADTPPITTWRLDDEDLRSMTIPDSVFSILERHSGVEYSDTQALLSALNQDLAPYPLPARVASNALRVNLELMSETASPEIDSFRILPVLKIWMDSSCIADLRRMLVSKAGLRPIPKPLLELASGLVGVEFPTAGLLHAALRSRLALALGRGRYANELRRSQGVWQPIDSAALAGMIAKARDDSAAAVRACYMDTSSGCPMGVRAAARYLQALEGIQRIPANEALCSRSQKLALESLIDTLYDRTLRAPVAAFAAKRNTDVVGQPPRWSGEGCGCSRDALDNEIYGFFVAGPDGSYSDSAIQRIDFEVLQRIEYFGITFDRNGDLVREIPADSSDAFLREARAHGTRVDWVVAQTDPDFWSRLTPSERTKLFANLRKQILSLLRRPPNSLWDRLKAYVPFPHGENLGWGDGVTLQFPSYPATSEAIAAFDSLYRDLLKDLAAQRGRRYHLNVVFPAADLAVRGGMGSYAHVERLLGILDSIHPELPFQDKPSRILILMDSPSEDSRRLIQRHIDETYSSDIRRRFQHSLVPVLFPQTRSLSGFRDDVVYLNDTYFAMGVWPLPTRPAPERPAMTAQDSVSSILWEYFAPEDDGPRQNEFDAFVCVHRWLVRLALLLSLLVAGVAGVMLVVFCRIRQRLGHQLPLAIAALVFAPLALFSLVLYVDPDLAALREGNVPYLIVSGLFVLTVAGVGAYFRLRKPNPSRDALRQALARKLGESQE